MEWDDAALRRTSPRLEQMQQPGEISQVHYKNFADTIVDSFGNFER